MRLGINLHLLKPRVLKKNSKFPSEDQNYILLKIVLLIWKHIIFSFQTR